MGNSKTMRRAGCIEPAQVLIQELQLSTRDRYLEETQPQLAAIGAAGRPRAKDRVCGDRDNAATSGQRGPRHLNTPCEVGGRRLAPRTAEPTETTAVGALSMYLIGDSPESRSPTSLLAPAMRRSGRAPLVQPITTCRYAGRTRLRASPGRSPHRQTDGLQVELLDCRRQQPWRSRASRKRSASRSLPRRSVRAASETTRRNGPADAVQASSGASRRTSTCTGGSAALPRWRPQMTSVPATRTPRRRVSQPPRAMMTDTPGGCWPAVRSTRPPAAPARPARGTAPGRRSSAAPP